MQHIDNVNDIIDISLSNIGYFIYEFSYNSIIRSKS